MAFLGYLKRALGGFAPNGIIRLGFVMTMITARVMGTITTYNAYQDRILETGTTFLPENNGVWTMADFTGDGEPDLIYIKTSSTPSGHVEVHVASAASNYQTRIFEKATTFANEDNGTWLVGDFSNTGRPDLIYIKTQGTGTGTVEVHVASYASQYQTRIFESGTTFLPEQDGVWTMADTTGNGKLDLVFIKTKNTGTGKVEVHIASGTSNYQTRVLETGTVFDPAIAQDGTWLISPFTTPIDQDLVFIHTCNSFAGRVEVEVAAYNQKYQNLNVDARKTTFLDEKDGTWLLTEYSHQSVPDLAFIKTANTGTGRVEVHIASFWY